MQKNNKTGMVLEGEKLGIVPNPKNEQKRAVQFHFALPTWNGSETEGPLACYGEAPSKTDCSAPSSYATKCHYPKRGVFKKQGGWRL